MLQHVRSNTSDSLFRESEFATIVLDDSETEAYFKQFSTDVAQNRKNSDLRYTGAQELRTQFLAVLKRLGDVQTANVWARKLLIEPEAIESLRAQIRSALHENHIYGVAEIHLQDYEINSTHIQFVGTQAKKAESLIADIVVRLGYEDSFASAMGRKERQRLSEIPATHSQIQPIRTKESTFNDDGINMEEELNKIQNLRLKLLKNKIYNFIDKIEKMFQHFCRKKSRHEKTETLMERYQTRKKKKE